MGTVLVSNTVEDSPTIWLIIFSYTACQKEERDSKVELQASSKILGIKHFWLSDCSTIMIDVYDF